MRGQDTRPPYTLYLRPSISIRYSWTAVSPRERYTPERETGHARKRRLHALQRKRRGFFARLGILRVFEPTNPLAPLADRHESIDKQFPADSSSLTDDPSINMNIAVKVVSF